ncbi:MAG: hypothetical protein ABI596_17485 [Pyrinomonadaceae bacterium]
MDLEVTNAMARNRHAVTATTSVWSTAASGHNLRSDRETITGALAECHETIHQQE